MKKILVISFSNLYKDPRVRRQLALLAQDFQVIAAGYQDPLMEDITFIETPYIYRSRPFIEKVQRAISLIGLRQYEKFYWTIEMHQLAYEKLKSIEVDLILANDLDTLPLAVRLSQEKNIPLHYDAHEYAPEEFTESWKWRVIQAPYRTFLCKKFLPQAQSMTTVCQGIAEAYQKNFQVEPLIVPNAAFYHDLPVSPLKPGKIRIIHHGVALPSRKLEEMLEMARYLDQRFSLDLMLVPSDPAYYQRLQVVSKENLNIRFLAPVTNAEIIPFCNQYDIGLYILAPSNFNNQHALPNKLFEFIQSRLAVAIGPSPEMARLVKQFDCGIVANDFQPQTLAKELLKLTPERLQQMKQNANSAAQELAFQKFIPPFLNRIKSLIKVSNKDH